MLRVAFMVFIRTRFFINDDDGTDNDGIDDDPDNNNADNAVCECIFSLYLIVFVVHYISSFPVAELLVIKIGIGVILLQICDELPVTPRVHRVLSLFHPSYRVNACFHNCTTHTVYNCPTHITHPS